jgi:hypothetical protein
VFIPHAQIEWNHWRVPSLRPGIIIPIVPEPGYPRGRKATYMARFWANTREADAVGVLWQDPDIVADPDDLEEMTKAIERAPEYVHCSVHKLWPASTMRPDWVWAHGAWRNNAPVMGQRMDTVADWFALGFTYTPARLLDIAMPHMFQWVFGQVDNGLAATARQHNIPAFPVPKCRPKHLHFYPREDDASWRPGMVNDRPAT